MIERQFISFSGGVESTAMCVLYGDKADAIFADTGFEHQEIYDRLDLVENWVQEFHRRDFKIHRIIPQVYHKGILYTTLPEYITATEFYPSFHSRYCTYLFKIKPIDDFLEQYKEDGVKLMIGLNYEEAEKRTGNHGNKKFVEYSYPLVDSKISRYGCSIILKKANLFPNFPVYMRRGGCKGCFYKSMDEYRAMAALNPEEFKIVEDLENAIQGSSKSFYTILSQSSMANIRKQASMGFFKPEEVYPVINNATPCGVFCNR